MTEMRVFETGATRNIDTNKLDYEGFESPYVMEAYAQYMHKNRIQADGKLRASDNWQKGIPETAYMKSMFRHFMEVWRIHRESLTCSLTADGADAFIESLCALRFNVNGMLHELLKVRRDWNRDKPKGA